MGQRHKSAPKMVKTINAHTESTNMILRPSKNINLMTPVLRIRIRDWVLFDPWIRDPGSEIGFFRIPDPGSRIPDPKTIFLRAF